MFNIPNYVLQLENHLDEDIRERGGAVVTRIVGVRRDRGGRTERYGDRVAELVAAERDYDRDVSDHVPLPNTLRDPRLPRELPPQEAAPNTTGAVKGCLLITTDYTSICNQVYISGHIRLFFRFRIMVLNLLNLYSLIFALFRKISSMVRNSSYRT